MADDAMARGQAFDASRLGVLLRTIVLGRMLPPEHGSIAEFIGLDVRDSVLTPIASQTVDTLALDDMSDAARRVVTQAMERADESNTGVTAELVHHQPDY